MGRLDGMTAVVTGAARGLGRFVAEGYARQGATLHLCDRMEVPKLDGATGHVVDLRDRGACRAFAAEVLEQSGGIDVLVNNAGVLYVTPATEVSDEEWDEVLAVNLTAPFVLCQSFLPTLRKRGGSIVNVSSRAAIIGMNEEAHYCASKFGIEGLTRALAVEAGPNVSVNTITPGARIKPTMMTEAEEAAIPPDARAWKDADVIVPAFVLLALARGNPTGKRFEADKLSEELNRQGVFK